MDKYLYPSHPVCCEINGRSECGKRYFLTKLCLNNINEFEKDTNLFTIPTSRFLSKYN